LGVHNLDDNFEDGRISVAVRNISIHYDWHPNAPSYDADIAVLELIREVQFDEFIQPICLVEPNSVAASVSLGIVAGFGKSEHRETENIARVINVPIYNYKHCTSDHHSMISHRTLCGGYANGTGVCKGDSGSGLIVLHDGIYYLRGIVSSSLYASTYECDVNKFSVFTDITEFSSWIKTGEDPNILLQRYKEQLRILQERLRIYESQKLVSNKKSWASHYLNNILEITIFTIFMIVSDPCKK